MNLSDAHLFFHALKAAVTLCRTQSHAALPGLSVCYHGIELGQFGTDLLDARTAYPPNAGFYGFQEEESVRCATLDSSSRITRRGKLPYKCALLTECDHRR